MSDRVSSGWADYPWPAWVPEGLKRELVSFWGPANGRGVRDYKDAMASENGPVNGAVIDMAKRDGDRWAHGEAIRPNGEPVYLLGHETGCGRFVYAWGNMGRLVMSPLVPGAVARVVVVSTHPLKGDEA